MSTEFKSQTQKMPSKRLAVCVHCSLILRLLAAATYIYSSAMACRSRYIEHLNQCTHSLCALCDSVEADLCGTTADSVEVNVVFLFMCKEALIAYYYYYLSYIVYRSLINVVVLQRGVR